VSAEESLVRIEENLSENLPLIGRKYAGFLSVPKYRGVSQVCSKTIVPYRTSMELQIEADCREEDKDELTRALNRELILLFEEKGIRLM
ncbi:MAG: hypothetical protein II581_06900, partial [Oscillospiraceae bacterium]|nr:hypothetical protein [Oscillospiraceae bacterium]